MMKLALTLLLGSLAPFASAQDNDIPATATNATGFDTLVTALGAAGLVDVLSEPNGPYTVFAPTDDAFAALRPGLLDCLSLAENSATLSYILTYHVVEGAVESGDLEDGMTAETLQGETMSIDLSEGVTINDSASVVTADVMASNGVIHAIDSVLLPPSIDLEAFLDTCTDEDSPTAPPEDSGATVSTIASMMAATAVAALAL